MCYFSYRAQKIIFSRGFKLISKVLGKIQGGGQDGDHCGDVRGLQQRHHP